MQSYTDLIKALRYCVNARNCEKCAYRINNNSVKCRIKRVEDAADAIDELSKTVKDLTTRVECSPMQISEKAFDRAIEAWNEKARKEVQE